MQTGLDLEAWPDCGLRSCLDTIRHGINKQEHKSLNSSSTFLQKFSQGENMSAGNGHTYQFGDFRLIPGEGLLLRQDEPVPLSIKAFSTLVLLVERHGHLVSKSDLLDTIWDGSFVEEGAISRSICTIRSALGDDPKSGAFIRTVPRRGYRFVAPVSILHLSGAYRLPLPPDDDGTDPEVVTPIEQRVLHDGTSAVASTNGSTDKAVVLRDDSGTNQGSSSRKPMIAGCVIAVAVIAVAFAYFGFVRTGRSATPRSFIVLPVAPIDSANGNLLYEFGIAESIINRLSSAEGFLVRPLSSVRPYSGSNIDPVAAGREQKVDYVLAPNYQIAGDRVKVRYQLINVASGEVEDSFQSVKEISDMFGAQEAIAEEFGDRLMARFGSKQRGPFKTRGTNNEEAYKLYLQATNLCESSLVPNVYKAQEYFERVVALDPNFAAGWASLADVHRRLASYSESDQDERYQKSMEAINKALAIDPSNAAAYSALCDNKFRYEYDFPAAETACRRAVELKPDSPDTHKAFTLFLYSRGRFDEAINEIRKAIELQPVSYRNQQIYGLTLFYARRFPEAEVQFVRLLELNPDHPFILLQLVNICEQQGKKAEAFDYFIRWLTATKSDAAIIERFKAAYAKSGWHGFTLKRIKMDVHGSSPFGLACLYASVGDKDKAFDSLETAYRNRSFKMAVLEVTPQLDPLRHDPRYQDLVRRVEGK